MVPSSRNISSSGSADRADTGMASILCFRSMNASGRRRVASSPGSQRPKRGDTGYAALAWFKGKRSCADPEGRLSRSTTRGLVSGKHDLRPVLEMHGVVVVPLAAPDEAMLLENFDDLPRNLVSVGKAPISVGLRPSPVVRMRGCNIDGNTQTVSTFAIRACDQATVVGALGRPQRRQKSRRQLVELIRYPS